MVSSWMTTRRHPSRPRKIFPSCKRVNYLHSASVLIDRPAVLRPREVNSQASIPSVARQVDARFPDPPAAVRSVFLPILPTQLLPAAHRGGPFRPDQSLSPPLLPLSTPQVQLSTP